MLRFIFIYSLCDYSFQQAGLRGTFLNLGSVSKTDLIKRFRKSRLWLGVLIVNILQRQKVEFIKKKKVRIRIMDATNISHPGSHNTDWRLHVGFNLGEGCLDEVHLTNRKTGESLTHFIFEAGDICLADRAYGVLRGITAIIEAKAEFVIRLTWHNLTLYTSEGHRFDIVGWLQELSQDPETSPTEIEVWINAPWRKVALRLVARAIPADKAEQKRKSLLAIAKKKKHKVDPKSLVAAGFVMVISNLSPLQWSSQEILNLYRLRWQVEVFFRHLKGLFDLDHLRSKDPDIAQVYLLAKILAAILIGQVQNQISEDNHVIFCNSNRPTSSWRLTQTLLEIFKTDIRGYVSLSIFLKHIGEIQRYLVDAPRKRKQQLTEFITSYASSLS